MFQWVLKAIKMTDAQLKESAKQEVNLLAKIDHPNIVKYKESFRNGYILHLVMEYCNAGDLAAFLKKWNPKTKVIPEETILSLTLQIANALQV